MIDVIGEVRASWYSGLNNVSFYILFIFQLIHIRQKKKFPNFCVQSVQNFLGTRSSNIMGKLTEDNRWYKKLLGKIISFFSFDLWILIEMLFMAGLIQYNGVYNKPFGEAIGTGANYFALLFFNGGIYLIACIVLGVSPLKQMDWIAPSYPLALIFVKLACFCAGCCYGIEWEHGLYSYRNERYEVPTQLIETFLALVIFIILMVVRKKAKKGTLFPMYLILYSGTRFFSEFLRREENVLGPLKVYHILCIIGVVEGIILLFIVNKFGDKIDNHFDKYYRGVIGVIVQKIRRVNDDGTYTEEGRLRKEKIRQKRESAKKKREVRKRKPRIKF